MAEKACHGFGSTTQVGLTQALGPMARVLGGLILAALVVGGASGLLLFGGIGIFVTLPLALAVAVFLGAPAYFLLRKLGWLAWWHVTLAGILLVTPFAVGMLPNWYFVNATLISGAVAGLVFWWAGIGPNRSFNPNPLRSTNNMAD